MSIKRTPSGLSDELRRGKDKVKEYLSTYDQHLALYTTPAYGAGGGNFAPENHDYERIALVLPQCVSGTPMARFSTTRDGQAQVTAQALTYAYNHWARASNLRAVNERLAVDMLFRFAVALVTSEPRPGFEESEDQPFWPAVRRLSLKRFVFDPAALAPEQWCFSGHQVIRARDAVIEAADSGLEKGWDVERLRGLKVDTAVRQEDGGEPRPPRDEIQYWELWIPDWAAVGEKIPEGESASDGFHGWIYTVMDDETDKPANGFIREPRRYFGPPTGPYVFQDCYPVPDESIGLAPLVAERGMADYLNRIKRATMRSVGRYKRLILARQLDEDTIQQINDATGDNVVGYEGDDVRTAVAQFEVGGATDQHLVAAQDARATLDRVSGESDAMRGQVTGDATATENAIAGQAGATRTGFIVGKFMEMQVRIAYSVAYFIHRDEDVVIDLPAEAVGTFLGPNGEVLEHPRVQGGVGEDEDAEDFHSLDLSIDVGSFSKTPQQQAQEKLVMLTMTMQEIVALAPFAAFLDIAAYLELKAQLASMPELKRLANVEAMQMVSGMQIAAGLQPQGGQGAGPSQGSQKPQQRFAGDIEVQGSANRIKGAGARPGGRPAPNNKPQLGAAGKGSSRAVPVRSA